MAAKSRIWDFPIIYRFLLETSQFFEGMYFFSVATFSEGMLFSGVVKYFRNFID